MERVLAVKLINMLTQTKTISKSNKPRFRKYPAFDKGRYMGLEIDRSAPPMHFKQVVEIEQIGKNKSGKPIHTSRTRHVPA